MKSNSFRCIPSEVKHSIISICRSDVIYLTSTPRVPILVPTTNIFDSPDQNPTPNEPLPIIEGASELNTPNIEIQVESTTTNEVMPSHMTLSKIGRCIFCRRDNVKNPEKNANHVWHMYVTCTQELLSSVQFVGRRLSYHEVFLHSPHFHFYMLIFD